MERSSPGTTTLTKSTVHDWCAAVFYHMSLKCLQDKILFYFYFLILSPKDAKQSNGGGQPTAHRLQTATACDMQALRAQ